MPIKYMFTLKESCTVLLYSGRRWLCDCYRAEAESMFDDMFPSPSLQSQHQLLHLHPHLLPVPPPDRNPMMPCSSLVRRVKKVFMASVASGQQEVLSPIFTHQATGVGQKEAEKIKASRTPLERQTLPLLRTPPFPTAPAVPTPPQTINCGQFRSRLPRLKKTASCSMATAVGGGQLTFVYT